MKRGRFAFIFASSALLLVLTASESFSQTDADFSGLWFLSQSKAQPELFVPNSPENVPPPSPFGDPPLSIAITQTPAQIQIVRRLASEQELTGYDRDQNGHVAFGQFGGIWGTEVDELSILHHGPSRASLMGNILTISTDRYPNHPSIGRTKETYTLDGGILTLLEIHDLPAGRLMRTLIYHKP